MESLILYGNLLADHGLLHIYAFLKLQATSAAAPLGPPACAHARASVRRL
jgi:hypothetical protein